LIATICLISGLLHGTDRSEFPVSAAEYFIDSDPGLGNGQPISLTSGADVIFDFTAVTAGLSRGVHRLYVRSQTADGDWGVPQCRPFIIQQTSPLAETPPVMTAEYFIDSDPGLGNGQPISLTSGADVSFDFIAVTAGLTRGVHRLYVRSQTADGDWGVPQCRPFIIQQTSPLDEAPRITAFKFWWDNNPATQQLLVVPIPTADVDRDFVLPTNGLAAGTHTLTIKARNENGTWGIPQKAGFSVITRLDSPQNVTISCPGDSVALDWEQVPNATGYRIFYSATADGEFTDVTSSGHFDTGRARIAWVGEPTRSQDGFFYVKAVSEPEQGTRDYLIREVRVEDE
jgi:hypothetical protein